MRIFLLSLIFAAASLVNVATTNAHDAFKEPLEKRYNLKTVSCKTCHPNNKDRSIHNAFGKLLESELNGKGITEKFKEAEAKGEEAVKEYEPEMVKHFLEALKVVEKKQMTFEDLMKYGLLNGVRTNPPEKDK